VPAEVGLAAFRTVQESLSNIRKHAPDSVAVEVEVSRSGGGLSVRVANTLPEGSVAKTPAAGGQQSFGLAGLAERAAALGGTFSSGPDQAGYANHAFFPLPAAGQRTAPKEPHD
jgi:signal transduction histidine kinase